MKRLLLQFVVILMSCSCVMAQTSKELVLLSTDSLMNLGRKSDTDTKVAYLCFSTVANRYSTDMSNRDAENCALALNNCGYILFHAYEDYAKAYFYLAQAADVVKRHNLKKIEPIVCLNMGNLYLTYANRSHDRDDNLLAMKQYQQGYWAAKETGQQELMVLNFTNVCAIEVDDLKPHKLPPEFADFEHSHIADSVPGARFARHMSRAIVLAQQGKYDQARQLFRENLAVIDATFSPERYEYSCYACIGKTFMVQEQLDSAVHYNKMIEQLAARHHMPEVTPETYNNLSRCYEALGNKAMENEYHSKYLAAKDSLLSINHLDEVGKLHFINELYKADEELKQMAEHRHHQHMAIVVGSVVLVIIFLSLIFVLHKNRIIRNRNLELYRKNVELLNADKIQATRKYQNSSLSSDTKDDLYDKITQFFVSSTEFCQPDFTIEKLAQAIGSKQKYVSQVINERMGCSFSILLSDARVKEACRRMNDNAGLPQLTIEAIANDVGFKSRVTFLTTFKRVTGLTPTEYRKIAARGGKAE